MPLAERRARQRLNARRWRRYRIWLRGEPRARPDRASWRELALLVAGAVAAAAALLG